MPENTVVTAPTSGEPIAPSSGVEKRICKRCGEEKALGLFHQMRGKPTRLCWACKSDSARSAAREANKARRAKKRAAARAAARTPRPARRARRASRPEPAPAPEAAEAEIPPRPDLGGALAIISGQLIEHADKCLCRLTVLLEDRGLYEGPFADVIQAARCSISSAAALAREAR